MDRCTIAAMMNPNLLSILDNIYGPSAQAQEARYNFAIDRFRRLFGSHLKLGEGIHICRAPGRVNLIGEHTDYNHGYVMPAALDKDFVLLASPRDDHQVHLVNIESRFSEVRFEIGPEIPIGEQGDWGNYARGAAQALSRSLGRSFSGFDGLVVGAAPYGVPIGSGLSSSSALTVAMIVVMAHFADWNGEKTDLVGLSSDAEWYVGTRGGIMDQYVALLAEKEHALFLDCRPDSDGGYYTEAIPLPLGYRLMVVDSGIRHENTRGEFNQRVAAGRAGVGLLKARFPEITHLRDVERVPWSELEPMLPEEQSVRSLQECNIDLTDIPGLSAETSLRVRARCRHVWHENQRVIDAVKALKSGDMAHLGLLLAQAHNSARDDYEISVPELEVLVKAASEQDGVVGARLTGAGWGGCVIALVEEDAVADFSKHVEHVYRQETGKRTAIFACQATSGAEIVL